MKNQIPGCNPATEARIGGALCLDFTNTVGSWGDPRGTEKLHIYGDLLRWAEDSDALDAKTISRLRRTAARRPHAATKICVRAIVFRNALYSILRAYVDGLPLVATHLALVNRELSDFAAASRLVSSGRGFRWHWGG